MQPPNPYEEEKGEGRSTNSTAENTPTEPKPNLSIKFTKMQQLPNDRATNFTFALAESRLTVRMFTFCRG